MPADLRVNTSLDADQRLQRLQQLRARQAVTQAAIEAEIAALSSSARTPSSSYQQQSRVQKHHRRSSNVPRSMSSSGATMARHLSVGQLFGPLSCTGSNDK
jgi:acetylornithine deacetylase/succinyl-diaminopimelate desuccinylase-like protein